MDYVTTVERARMGARIIWHLNRSGAIAEQIAGGARETYAPYLAGVTKQIALAHHKGPYFAGAVKGLGDVLVKPGCPVEALARFETALNYAPNLRKRAR